jgi:hypothetical protein
MANIPEGPYPPANGGYSPLLVQKLANRPYTPLFKQVYGQDAFQVFSPKQIYELFGEAIAAYESSGELCAFSSKYDASKYGTPPKNLAFDLRKGPPSGYTPLFPPPEVLDNVQNVTGVSPSQATPATESNGQIGNLQLSKQQEEDLVNFLKILTDGYTRPNPVSP